MTKQNQKDDSFTEVNICRSGRRVVVGFRCDSGLWEAFKKALSANGQSTCEILENIILGLTVGLTTKVNSSKTINVYCEVPKFVRRVRRARVEYVDEEEYNDKCWYCGADAVGFLKRLSSGRVYAVCGECMQYYLRFERDRWVAVESR